jgi:hypothetical protein
VIQNADGSTQINGNSVIAYSGTRLPVSARFKGNVIARYELHVADHDGFLQTAVVGQTNVVPVLQTSQAIQIGRQPGYATFDLSGGVHIRQVDLALFVLNAFDRRAESVRFGECPFGVCAARIVLPVPPRSFGVTISEKF